MNIELLKQSPLFNFSLASKELFHSNFLDWLIYVEKEKMSNLFSNIIGEPICICKCDREKRNFDLYLSCSENKKIVIENKFKSIISEAQLKKYNESLKGEDTFKILLSLNNTDYEKSLSQKNLWIPLSYGTLCSELKKFEFKDEYHKKIVNDYCTFVEEVESYFSEKNYSEYTISDMYKDYDHLREVRLHDISQKILFNYLLRELRHKILNSKKKYGDILTDKLTVTQGFTRGTGIVTMAYHIRKETNGKGEFRLELQLQFDRLKFLLIHRKPKELPENIRDRFFNIIKELSNTSINRESGELFPKGDKKKYNRYGENAIYMNFVLSKNLTTDKIISSMIRSFDKIVELGEDYSKLKV